MSLKGDKYETVEEIQTRLESTVVVYDGKLVYITKVRMPEAAEKEIARVFFKYLPMNKPEEEHRKYLSSKKFDLAPFKMGYANIGNQAIFLSRNPVRQYRQGLQGGNFTSTDIFGKKVPIGFNGLITDKSFVDMYEGNYPSFKEAGDLMQAGSESVAISRNFALGFDTDLDLLVLRHKSVTCGCAFIGDKNIRVPAKFHFLKQEMEEFNLPIA